MPDTYDLNRFAAAQDSIYNRVLDELRQGSKRSHWMWFIFPQVAGLGFSATARAFAIATLGEARAYLAHPVLGERLLVCTGLVNRVTGRTAHAIFGSPDDLKFRSSMTLFGEAAPEQPLFSDALAIYFGGEPDRRTLELLSSFGTLSEDFGTSSRK